MLLFVLWQWPRWTGWLLVELSLCLVVLHQGVWRRPSDPHAGSFLFGMGCRVMLLMALLACASRWGWDRGLLLWLAMVAVATVLVLALLPWLSRRTRAWAPQSLVLGLALAARWLC